MAPIKVRCRSALVSRVLRRPYFCYPAPGKDAFRHPLRHATRAPRLQVHCLVCTWAAPPLMAMTTSPCWPPRPAQQPTARALLPAWGAAGRMTARHLCHVRVQRLCLALALPWRAATRTRLLACRRPLRSCVAAGLARARRRRRAKLSRRRVQRLQQRGRAALGQMHAAQRAALRAAGRVRRGEGLCCELFGSGEGLSGGITRNDHLAMSAQRVSPADLNLCMFHTISHLLTSSPQ